MEGGVKVLRWGRVGGGGGGERLVISMCYIYIL